MDNHLHVLVRLDQQVAAGWSDEEVVRRWGRLFPPRDKSRQPLPVSNAWVEDRLKHPDWVATARVRLQSLSWFMKCLKEPLSRMANRDENVRGAFFEGRFKSVAVLDEEALLAVCSAPCAQCGGLRGDLTPARSLHTTGVDEPSGAFLKHAARHQNAA